MRSPIFFFFFYIVDLLHSHQPPQRQRQTHEYHPRTATSELMIEKGLLKKNKKTMTEACAPAWSDGAAAFKQWDPCESAKHYGVKDTLFKCTPPTWPCPLVKSTESSKTSDQIKSVYTSVSLQSQPDRSPLFQPCSQRRLPQRCVQWHFKCMHVWIHNNSPQLVYQFNFVRQSRCQFIGSWTDKKHEISTDSDDWSAASVIFQAK